MVKPKRNVLGDITNQLPKKNDSKKALKREEKRRKHRTPLGDITHHFPEQQPKTTRISDEEKMHYVLQYYSTPLINGKMKLFSTFLKENNITEKGATLRRVWEKSGLKDLRKKEASMSQARLAYIQWAKEQKETIAMRNKNNGFYNKLRKQNAEKEQTDTDGHCDKTKSDDNRKEESSDNDIGKDII